MKQYKITENNITYDITKHPNGDKYWYKNGKYHRENGPAVILTDLHKAWYKNGLLHRSNGPAVEYVSGSKEYWYNGKRLNNIKSDEDLKRYIKLLSIS